MMDLAMAEIAAFVRFLKEMLQVGKPHALNAVISPIPVLPAFVLHRVLTVTHCAPKLEATMAHKDNTKNAENAEKLLAGNGGAPVIEEVIVEAVVVKTGHHTGVVQTYPVPTAVA